MRTKSFQLFPVLLIIVFFISQCAPGNQPAANPPTSPASASTAVQAVAPTDSSAPTVAAPPSSSSLDGQSLAKERCTQCHSFDRIQNAKKSPDEWKSTVARMVGKGANLNSDEQQVVIDYLSKTFTK